jgi:GTP-binding protein Era
MRCGTVAIIGRTNVGKSTFLNACLGERIAIVSPLPQTTRDELLGVVHRETSQIAFTDTPGFHRPKSELGRRMNQAALDTVRSHDAVIFMTDVGRLSRPRKVVVESKRLGQELADPVHPDDRRLLSLLRPETPCVLVVNKVDLLKDKGKLLPLIAAFSELYPFAAVIPTSVRSGKGVDNILDELEMRLPEAEPGFSADALTDKPATFFVREFVREQVMLETRREVPHAVAVTVERYDESTKLIRIQATIHVEKAGQRIILVGRGGEQIKSIGVGARARLEELLAKQVHLELFVRVTERWKDVPRQLREMGYEVGGGRDLSSVLGKAPSGGPGRKKKNAGRSMPKRPPRQDGAGAGASTASSTASAASATKQAASAPRGAKKRPHPKRSGPRRGTAKGAIGRGGAAKGGVAKGGAAKRRSPKKGAGTTAKGGAK